MGAFNSKLSKEDLQRQFRKEMEDWEVNMYRNNPHLHYIPELSKERKRREIRERLGIEN